MTKLYSEIREKLFEISKDLDKLANESQKLHHDPDIEWDIPFPPVSKPKFEFIDLFAGIGGFRIAMQELEGRCVFSSEWDNRSRLTYENNFGEIPYGDITQIEASEIPNHKILLAGFPCQAFSIAGYKKGFEDTRGTLFFEIARIVEAKKPEAFILENVKNLVTHKQGTTIRRMLSVLRDDLKYFVPKPEILNALDFGLPQNRERVFIVGFKDEQKAKHFKYPVGRRTKYTFDDVREKSQIPIRYFLSDRYLTGLIRHKARHKEKGNGFGYQIIDKNDIAHTIVLGGMGRERNLIKDKLPQNRTPTTNIQGPINSEGIRRMTPREWARLQGFDDKFDFPKSASRYRTVAIGSQYTQLANAVAVPVVKKIGEAVIKSLGL